MGAGPGRFLPSRAAPKPMRLQTVLARRSSSHPPRYVKPFHGRIVKFSLRSVLLTLGSSLRFLFTGPHAWDRAMHHRKMAPWSSKQWQRQAGSGDTSQLPADIASLRSPLSTDFTISVVDASQASVSPICARRSLRRHALLARGRQRCRFIPSRNAAAATLRRGRSCRACSRRFSSRSS